MRETVPIAMARLTLEERRYDDDIAMCLCTSRKAFVLHGGCETKFFWLGHDACFRTKAALARAHSKTLRAQRKFAKIRQVLERWRASAAFPCAPAVYI